MLGYGKNRVLNSGMLLSLFLVGCSSFYGGSKDQKLQKPNASRIAEGDGVRLSEAIQKNLKTTPIAPKREKFIRDIAFSNVHRKKASALTYEACLKKYDQAGECLFVKKDWAQEWVEEWSPQDGDLLVENKKVSKRARQKLADKIIKNINAGSLESVPAATPGDFYRALKHFQTWTPALDAFAQKIISEPKCMTTDVYSYLGLKAEEFFPDPAMLTVAQKIYSKGDECAANDKDSKYVQNTRFRLGLLSVLAKKCDQAKRVFDKLAKQNSSDYTTRALYWGAHCAKSESDQDAFISHYEQLFKTNPLGFHTLSMGEGNSILSENLGKPIDPIVQTRTEMTRTVAVPSASASASGGETKSSTVTLQLNNWISVIEDLDYLGEKEAVRRLLAPVRRSPAFLVGMEPGVRLYLSTFAFRAQDRLSLFRVLDSVFRTQSEYVVDSTMKLFYPMEHFDHILTYTKKVNPFLITALIRQESAFQSEAKSQVGAIGLMQLMPRTAKLMDRKVSRKQLFNAEVNVRLGVRYFEGLVDRFGGDVELALAGYNAGPEAVDRWLKRYPVKNRMLFLDLIPFSETRNYVTLIGRNYYWYHQLYANQLNAGTDVASRREPSVFNGLRPTDDNK